MPIGPVQGMARATGWDMEQDIGGVPLGTMGIRTDLLDSGRIVGMADGAERGSLAVHLGRVLCLQPMRLRNSGKSPEQVASPSGNSKGSFRLFTPVLSRWTAVWAQKLVQPI